MQNTTKTTDGVAIHQEIMDHLQKYMAENKHRLPVGRPFGIAAQIGRAEPPAIIYAGGGAVQTLNTSRSVHSIADLHKLQDFSGGAAREKAEKHTILPVFQS